MKQFAFILLVFTLLGCKKHNDEIQNLNGNRIDVLGHAGMGINSQFPINSGESLLACLNKNSDGTELDLQLTKDGVLVAFHDILLQDKTSLSGRIREKNWDELKNAQYTSNLYYPYKIVKLRNLLDNLPNYKDFIFTFDIKIYGDPVEDYLNYYNDYTDAITDLFSLYQLHQNAFTEVREEEFIELLQQKDALIRQFVNPLSFDEGFQTANNLNLFGITISNSNITKEEVELAHSLNKFVTIWGVNSKKENKSAVAKFPDIIQTDKLDHLIKYLQ